MFIFNAEYKYLPKPLTDNEVNEFVVRHESGLLLLRDFQSITSGFSSDNFYTTGTSYQNGIIYYDRNDSLSAYSTNLLTPYFRYTDYSASTNNPTPLIGRTFFDYTENALSYYPNTPNMDVTINLGQEDVIYVLNNSGTNILNGQACHIHGSLSGFPTIDLAISSGNTDCYVSGIATHDIQNGEFGFITNRGLVRDLTITGVSEGTIIYLSDTIFGGYVYSINDLQLTSRISKIGRVITTGVTTAKIYVDIENENSELSLTTLQRNVLEGNILSTGAYYFTGITLISTTAFSVSPLKGWIVYNTNGNSLEPYVKYIDYSGATSATTPYLTSHTLTYLLINSGNTLVMQTTSPTPEERRNNIFVGKIVHPNKTNILYGLSQPDIELSPMSQLRDIWTPINLINYGVYPSPNTGLTFNTTSGTLYGLGIGFINNSLNPSSIWFSGNSPTTFQYRVQTGGTFSDITNIDPTNYDVGGVITSVPLPGKKSTNQRIYLTQNGLIRIQYGQTTYSDLTAAIAAIQTESFVVFPNFRTDAVLIGVLSVRSDATDLTNTSQAKFLWVSKFGETIGAAGGISTATLQSAYDNSSTPEILTNSTLDGFQIRSGTGSDTSKNLIIENNSSVETAWIKANGNALFTNITGTSIYGTTLYSGTTNIHDIFITQAEGNIWYVNTSGDTMTGPLIINANLTVTGDTHLQALTASTINATSLSAASERVITTSGSPLLQNYLTTDQEFITNSTVISNLLNASNWKGDTYIGSTTGLVEGQKYQCCNYFYLYSNSTVQRYKNSPKQELVYLTYSGLTGTLSGSKGVTKGANGYWTATSFNTVYYIDDSNGDMTITIPDATSYNEGLSMWFSKPRLVQSDNQITIRTISGQKIAQNTTFNIYAPDERYQLVSCNFGSGGIAERKYCVVLGTDNEPHVLRVSPYSTLFTDIKSAVDYANSYIMDRCVILVEPGDYNITEPIIVTKDKLKISGRGVGITNLCAQDAMSGQSIFTVTQDFEIDNLTMSGCSVNQPYSAIQFSGTPYSEVQNVVISNFQRGICFSIAGTEVWIFNSIINDCSLAGVCNLGGSSIGVSECTFENNNYGINFFTGDTQRHSVQNTIFIVNSGQTGIQWNTTGNTYEYAAFSNNIFNGNGTYISGFTWTAVTDADIRMENNVGIDDYSPKSYIEFVGNLTTTTLTNQDEYYKLNGTNSVDSFGIKFNVEDNKATYLPTTTKRLTILVTGEIEVNANCQNLKVAIYKNGSIKIAETMVRAVTQNIGYNFAMNKVINVNEDDYFEIFAVNTTSAGKNVILDNLNFTIKV